MNSTKEGNIAKRQPLGFHWSSSPEGECNLRQGSQESIKRIRNDRRTEKRKQKLTAKAHAPLIAHPTLCASQLMPDEDQNEV